MLIFMVLIVNRVVDDVWHQNTNRAVDDVWHQNTNRAVDDVWGKYKLYSLFNIYHVTDIFLNIEYNLRWINDY